MLLGLCVNVDVSRFFMSPLIRQHNLFSPWLLALPSARRRNEYLQRDFNVRVTVNLKGVWSCKIFPTTCTDTGFWNLLQASWYTTRVFQFTANLRDVADQHNITCFVEQHSILHCAANPQVLYALCWVFHNRWNSFSSVTLAKVSSYINFEFMLMIFKFLNERQYYVL